MTGSFALVSLTLSLLTGQLKVDVNPTVTVTVNVTDGDPKEVSLVLVTIEGGNLWYEMKPTGAPGVFKCADIPAAKAKDKNLEFVVLFGKESPMLVAPYSTSIKLNISKAAVRKLSQQLGCGPATACYSIVNGRTVTKVCLPTTTGCYARVTRKPSPQPNPGPQPTPAPPRQPLMRPQLPPQMYYHRHQPPPPPTRRELRRMRRSS